MIFTHYKTTENYEDLQFELTYDNFGNIFLKELSGILFVCAPVSVLTLAVVCDELVLK